jgi:signal transduction histidine kinase
LKMSGNHPLFQDALSCVLPRFASVLECSTTLHLALLGRDGVVRWANPTMAEFLDCEVSRLIGRNITEFLAIHDTDLIKGYQAGTGQLPEEPRLVNFLQNNNVPQTLRCSFIPVDTMIILVAEPMLESNRSMQEELLQLNNQLVVLSRENTRKGRELEKTVRALSEEIEQRKKAKAELLRYQNQLEEMVRNRTAALELARTEAEAANRAKTAFLANVSHELRTPLNTILGFAHLIKNDPLTPRQLQQLEKMSTAARQLLGILNNILDIARMESRKIPLEIQDFEPVRVIDHVYGTLAEQAAAKGLDLLVALDPLPPVLRGDGRRLGQILLNLVGNAVKFTEKGSVTLRGCVVARKEKEVTLRFEVHDTGVGMADEQVERLFQAFAQADDSKTRRFGGLGLGLTISRQFVELMGGRLGVESEIGRGSMFWLEIPFETSRYGAPAPSGRLDQELSQRRGAHILLAEDSVVTQNVASQLLESLGMLVSIAENGQKAVEMARAAFYDLILMDIQMPVMDGLQATAIIRGEPGYEAVPILAMTAGAFDEDRDRCLQAGMNDHLVKPVLPAKLKESLVKWLPARDAATPAPESKGAPVPNLSGQSSASVDWQQVADVLAHLEPLLATDDTAAAELFEQSSSLLITALGDEARKLGRQIRDFDYPDALQILSAIRSDRRLQGKAH